MNEFCIDCPKWSLGWCVIRGELVPPNHPACEWRKRFRRTTKPRNHRTTKPLN